jgi:O-antigen/teichoic acid export membrane protein
MFKKLSAVSQKLSPGLKRIVGNIGWLSIEKVLTMFASLFVGIYVIRYLGNDNFGKLSYGVSFVSLFEALAKLGLDSIVVRNIVRDKTATEKILGTAFFLKTIGAVTTIVLIGCAIWTFKQDTEIRWITIIIAFSLLFNTFDVIDLWFQSEVLSRSVAIVRSIQVILSSIAKVIFIALKLPLLAFVLLILVDYFFRAIGLIGIYLKHDRSLKKWKVNLPTAIELLKDSYPLIVAAVMVTIYFKIDQVMLGNMVSDEAVGNYAAAVRFSELWYFIPIAICSSVFPTILRAKERSDREYQTRLQQLYDLMAAIALVIAIPMTFCSKTLITTLLGGEYAPAGDILALHIWAGLFAFLGLGGHQWLMAENFTWFSSITTSLGAVTNIILNYLFIPSYGGVGAAAATVISYGISSHVTFLLYPATFAQGWKMTKALFIPLRIQQNLIYLKQIKSIL